MKTRVLNELKTNFAKFGFKKEELEGVAEIIAGNLAENSTDEEIHNAVSGAEKWATLVFNMRKFIGLKNTTKQLVEAFLDVSFVRKRKNPMEGEE